MERFRFVALDNEGRRYFAIGNFDRAVDVRAEAIAIADRLFGKDNNEYHRILAEQSAALARAGRVDEARSVFLESLERYGEKNGADSTGYASWSLRDWPIEIAAGNLESAERKLRDRILEKVAEDDLDVVYWVEMLGIYAMMRMDAGDLEDARQALDWAARGAASAPEHPWTHFVRVVEADYWNRLGDRERAIQLAEPALRILEERFPTRVDDIRRARAIIDS
jgi:tetratricopeptide (TPR) repeat protein